MICSICKSISDGADTVSENAPVASMTYDELSEEQIKIFNDIIAPYPDRIKADEITPEDADAEQLEKIKENIVARKLPANGKSLFDEHKIKINYTDMIKKETAPPQESQGNGNGNGDNNWSAGGNSGGGNSGGGTIQQPTQPVNPPSPPSGGDNSGGGSYIVPGNEVIPGSGIYYVGDGSGLFVE